MELKISIDGLNSNEATDVINACQKAIDSIEDLRATPPSDPSAQPIKFVFSYESEPQTAFRGYEESTFSRYLNSTVKE